MNNIWHLVRKELWQTMRDRAMLAVIFIVPAIQIFILSYAINTDVRNLSLLIDDADRSVLSRELAERFCHQEYFVVRGAEESPQQQRRRLDRGEAVALLRIPAKFSEDLKNGRRPALQLVIDGQNSNQALIAQGYAARIVQAFSLDRLSPAPASARRPLLEIAPRVLYNPELKSRHYMVPGVLSMMLLVVTTLLTTLALVKEREIGTLEQLMVTPIRKHQLILGKVIPFFGLGLIMIAVAGTIAVLWFGVPFRGSLLTLGPFLILFLLCTLSLGILISTLSRTQQQAVFVAWFFLIFGVMLSGFFYPIDNMPRFFQYLTLLNPLRYFLAGVREIFLKGTGWDGLWPDALGLALFGVTVCTLAVWRFRKRLD